jgi:glycosyltransferase involved in cell wall biosynthesis
MVKEKNYILVTPCKNEEKNLPNLIESVISQTIKPILWVVVDDGSTDNTQNLLQDVENRNKWIKTIRLNSNKRDLGTHLASVVNKGFNVAVNYCEENNLEYNYLGILDADLILKPTFYENILKEFKKNPKLGIASGGTRHIIGNKIVIPKLSANEPSGGHMVIRKECFEQCGGIPISYAFDSVLKAKARLRGWETRRFENFIVTEVRGVAGAEGFWKGYFHKGRTSYYLDLHPIHVFCRVITYTIKRRPLHLGIAYMMGYTYSILKREEKINDKEVRQYFRNKWKSLLKENKSK